MVFRLRVVGLYLMLWFDYIWLSCSDFTCLKILLHWLDFGLALFEFVGLFTFRLVGCALLVFFLCLILIDFGLFDIALSLLLYVFVDACM